MDSCYENNFHPSSSFYLEIYFHRLVLDQQILRNQLLVKSRWERKEEQTLDSIHSFHWIEWFVEFFSLICFLCYFLCHDPVIHKK